MEIGPCRQRGAERELRVRGDDARRRGAFPRGGRARSRHALRCRALAVVERDEGEVREHQRRRWSSCRAPGNARASSRTLRASSGASRRDTAPGRASRASGRATGWRRPRRAPSVLRRPRPRFLASGYAARRMATPERSEGRSRSRARRRRGRRLGDDEPALDLLDAAFRTCRSRSRAGRRARGPLAPPASRAHRASVRPSPSLPLAQYGWAFGATSTLARGTFAARDRVLHRSLDLAVILEPRRRARVQAPGLGRIGGAQLALEHRGEEVVVAIFVTDLVERDEEEVRVRDLRPAARPRTRSRARTSQRSGREPVEDRRPEEEAPNLGPSSRRGRRRRGSRGRGACPPRTPRRSARGRVAPWRRGARGRCLRASLLPARSRARPPSRLEVDVRAPEEVEGLVGRDPQRGLADLGEVAVRAESCDWKPGIGAARHHQLHRRRGVLDEAVSRSRRTPGLPDDVPVVEDHHELGCAGELARRGGGRAGSPIAPGPPTRASSDASPAGGWTSRNPLTTMGPQARGIGVGRFQRHPYERCSRTVGLDPLREEGGFSVARPARRRGSACAHGLAAVAREGGRARRARAATRGRAASSGRWSGAQPKARAWRPRRRGTWPRLRRRAEDCRAAEKALESAQTAMLRSEGRAHRRVESAAHAPLWRLERPWQIRSSPG